MNELRCLLTAYDAHRAAGRACALATVVHVEGSAYRRPGARMLVTSDGQLTGAISGGCLEGDARRRAAQVLHRGRPALVTYDSTDEDDAWHGTQQGCRGVIQLLVEPLDPTRPDNPLELLRRAADSPEPVVLATVFGPAPTGPVGLRRLLLPQAPGAPRSPNPEASLDYLADEARRVLASGTSRTCTGSSPAGPVQVLLEVVRPPVRLTVYGAGNDAQPLVRFAAALGWEVTVLDGRPALATAARFPEAAAVRLVPLAAIATQPRNTDFTVLMTHNYPYELAVLRHLLGAAPPYIGLLGPRKKAERLLTELRAEGQEPATHFAGRLHSPVGLRLGAETPAEIALAIVAEIQAVRTGQPAGFLSDAPGPIHPRTETELLTLPMHNQPAPQLAQVVCPA